MGSVDKELVKHCHDFMKNVISDIDMTHDITKTIVNYKTITSPQQTKE